MENDFTLINPKVEEKEYEVNPIAENFKNLGNDEFKKNNYEAAV